MIHAVRILLLFNYSFFQSFVCVTLFRQSNNFYEWKWKPLIQAAYRDNTLGLAKLCPKENLFTIDQSLLYTYLKNYYDPSRMVLTGVGVEHDDLVNFAKKYSKSNHSFFVFWFDE